MNQIIKYNILRDHENAVGGEYIYLISIKPECVMFIIIIDSPIILIDSPIILRNSPIIQIQNIESSSAYTVQQ